MASSIYSLKIYFRVKEMLNLKEIVARHSTAE